VLSADLSYTASNNSHFNFVYGPGTANFDVKTKQIMLTGYLDVISLASGSKPEGAFSSYVLLGIGQSQNTNSEYRCSSLLACTQLSYANGNTHSDTAWQIGIGAQYSINPNLAIEASLMRAYLGKTMGTDLPGVSSGINANLVTNVLSVGVVVPIGH
jgi:opacity protein-like surface antigen